MLLRPLRCRRESIRRPSSCSSEWIRWAGNSGAVWTPDLAPWSRSTERRQSAWKVPLIFRTNPRVPFVAVHVDLPDGSGRDLQTVVDTGCTYYALAVVPPASTWFRERIATATDTDSGSLQLVAARPRRLTMGS